MTDIVLGILAVTAIIGLGEWVVRGAKGDRR